MFNLFQTEERIDAFVQQEEGEVQTRRLLLEEKKRWQNYARGSHEVESAGYRGNTF